MKEKIIAYLKGPRPYAEGVALYEEFGDNLMLKATFRRQSGTSLARETLMEELRKLAGISESQFRLLPRLAVVDATAQADPETTTEKTVAEDKSAGSATKGANGEDHSVPDADNPQEVEGENTEAPESLKQVIKFRDRYPFLREPNCPEVLKVLVADLFAAYDRYKEAHAALVDMPDDADLKSALEQSRIAVESYLQDRSILEELAYYQEHHVLLGNHPKVAAAKTSNNLKDKTDLEVEQIRKNASANASKWKGKMEAAEEGTEERAKSEDFYRKWELVKLEAEQELSERKKNV